MVIKTCKFGGTSMADGNIIKSVKRIVESDPARRYIVVSAPGKRYFDDAKVTDLLYLCHQSLLKEHTCKSGFAPIRARFISIVKELNIDFDVISLLDQTERRIEEEGSREFTASRGEYLCARITAELLGAKFIDAANVIFFNSDGTFDGERSYRAVKEAVANCRLAVFPGFYGRGADGKVKTFSRGGSDITGAIVAHAVNASLYENWTDVSGFLACDPKIVDSPEPVKKISYKELRELSRMGASVIHGDSIFPVRNANIPIHIKNTFRPDDEGTLILPDSCGLSDGNPVVGIAGKKNFTVICIEKALKDEEHWFLGDVLGVLSREDVAVEHVPSGIDTLSLVIDSGQLVGGKLQKVIDGINEQVSPDSIRITENVALISTVGLGMRSSVSACSRLFTAIAAANANVRLISRCSSGINVIVGVDNADCERCICAIYSEFFMK